MPAAQATYGRCDRCGPPAGSAAVRAATVARRRLLKAAVFPPRTGQRTLGSAQPDFPAWPAARPHSAPLPRSVSGTLTDVSPQVLAVAVGGTEQRFTLSPEAVAWRGAHLEPTALRPGDTVTLRLQPSSPQAVDRIWANIGRVTGIIADRSGSSLVVDQGAGRGPATLAIRPRYLGRIQVRFPVLEPGYLIDVIGLRRGGELDGLIAATAQPLYPALWLPRPPTLAGHVAEAVTGSAGWREPAGEPPGVLGVGYPALEPEAGCPEAVPAGLPPGYPRLPYLALGSVLHVRNECVNLDCALPVTSCAPIARLFNDRCVTCGPSPRGRIVDLEMASFIALGGELDRGCFNATITIGE